MFGKSAVLLAALLFASAFTTAARADDTTAEALFRAGKQAVESGDLKTACEKFEQSQQLEPAPGTLLNLADCEERLGRLGLASQHFHLAAVRFRAGDPRIAYAKQRAAAAENHMPRLTIRVLATAPAQTTVLRDGVTLDPAALGQPLRVDPGEHVVLARAPGVGDGTFIVKLSQGEMKELLVEPSHDPASPAPPAPRLGEAAAAPEVLPVRKEPIFVPAPKDVRAPSDGISAEKTGPSRTMGWISVGIGGAGFALGTIFGLQAISNKSTIDSRCNATCDREGYDAQSSFDKASLLSTVGFGAAVLGIGAGTYFLLARPFDKRVTVSTHRAGLGLQLATEF